MKKLGLVSLFVLGMLSVNSYANDSFKIEEGGYIEIKNSQPDKTKWDKDYYDINGVPYTGTLYSSFWGTLTEAQIKDGKKVQEKVCMEKLCQTSFYGKEEGIISETDEKGQLKNGFIKKESKKLDNSWTEQGYEGYFINGVPDGLHKTFGKENVLAKETMYDQGRKRWEKKYTKFSGEEKRTETYYDKTGIILSRLYINGQIDTEKKYLYSGEPIQFKKYLNGSLLYTVDFNQDRTAILSVGEKEKHFLKNDRLYNIYYKNMQEFFPNGTEELITSPASKIIVHGKREVCSIPFPTKKYINTNMNIDNLPAYFSAGCYKNFESNFKYEPDIKLTDEQIESIYANPKEFFSKNEKNIDLKDVGDIDISQYKPNLEEIEDELEEVVNDIKESLVDEIDSTRN